MTDRELFEKALEAMEFHSCGDEIDEALIAALRERLAREEQMEQPEPDGLSWLKKDNNYFSQPKRKPWVGLTDEEMVDLQDRCGISIHQSDFEAIEAKLKEKNNG